MAGWQPSTLIDRFSTWGAYVGIAYLALAAGLFVAGAPELPLLILRGQPPSSIYGFWAAVSLVALAGVLAVNLTRGNPSKRLSAYATSPEHWPSVLVCVAAGVFPVLGAWDEPLTDSILRGIVVSLFCYVVIGQLWRMSWKIDWDAEHAQFRTFSQYVVEGRNASEELWTQVGIAVDGLEELQKLQLTAHAQFEHVRIWRMECKVALMRSDAGRNLMLATPEAASFFSTEEAQAAFQAQSRSRAQG